jgi:YD repeat-containing protein
VPVYGGNGNIMGYVDDSGTFVAKFEYDSYGDIHVWR